MFVIKNIHGTPEFIKQLMHYFSSSPLVCITIEILSRQKASGKYRRNNEEKLKILKKENVNIRFFFVTCQQKFTEKKKTSLNSIYY